MKKRIAIVLSVILLLVMAAGCGTSKADEKILIGVLQIEAHPALDTAYQGFVDALAEAGYVDGENITLDYQNAQGKISNCATIADKFVNDGCDLILAIATPAAQAAANATQDIPILITAVTDPASAQLVQSNEMPGTNVTGTSDLTPVRQQMELIPLLFPEATTVGFLYSSSESNSVFQIDIARGVADNLGLEYQDFTVNNTNDIQQVVTSMIGKVDVVYIPTDNQLAKAISTVSAIATENGLPIIVGEEGMVDGGGLASYSISYYELGKITGTQAVSILKGEGEPATMPIQYQENVTFKYNEEVAEALGVTIPEELLDEA